MTRKGVGPSRVRRRRQRLSRTGQPRLPGLLVVVALVLAACTGGGEQTASPSPAPSPEPATPTASPTVQAAASGVTQDIWVYENISTVDADGRPVDLTDALVEAVDDDLSEPVELAAGVVFHPAPALGAEVVDRSGQVRGDIDTVAGLVETDTGRAVQIVATPESGSAVAVGDTVSFDLGALDADMVGPGDPLITDYSFAQALPATGEQNLEPLERLSHRMAAGRLQFLAVDAEADPLTFLDQVGQARVAGAPVGPTPPRPGPSDPSPSASPSGPPAASTRSSAVAAASGATVTRVLAAPVGVPHGAARLLAQGGSGISAGVPAKAKPMLDGFTDGVKNCKDGANVKCVGEYYKDFGKGAEDSNDMLSDQICTGDCGPEPRPEPTPSDDDCLIFCDDPDPPPSCTGDCGDIDGDPHLWTFDGHAYDVQAVGEFVAARNGDLEVQARFSPYGDSRVVSVVSGVAVGFDDHTISLVGDPTSFSALDVVIDDEAHSIVDLRSEPVAVGDGAIRVVGDTLDIITPDDHRIVVSRLSSVASGFGLQIDPGEQAGWVGLLGDHDGDPENDLVTRGDEPIDDEPTFEDLYENYADSWRLTDDESLFDYAPGETTATFTDTTFPERRVTADTLPADQRARAAGVCEQAGVTNPSAVDACILDYATTGEATFVGSAQHADAVEDIRAGRLDLTDITTALDTSDDEPAGLETTGTDGQPTASEDTVGDTLACDGDFEATTSADSTFDFLPQAFPQDFPVPEADWRAPQAFLQSDDEGQPSGTIVLQTDEVSPREAVEFYDQAFACLGYEVTDRTEVDSSFGGGSGVTYEAEINANTVEVRVDTDGETSVTITFN